MQLPLHIDPASRVSLRQQLVDQLRQMIVDGLLAPRESERTLSRRGPI
jgi:DNA-binding GntR family transcriptional regulator